MRIAFYAPLKPPGHPTPSGDRQMARMLVRALEMSGATVEVVSQLRVFLPEPSEELWATSKALAAQEVTRIAAAWSHFGRPNAWYCYHPYYKSPDLLGPPLARRFEIPYFTAEASYSSRRNIGIWSSAQARLADAVLSATLNFCFTKRDHDGLAGAIAGARLKLFSPFVDTEPFRNARAPDNATRLITLAMMRKGDKYESYKMLAAALKLLPDLAWTLSVAGDGETRELVHALFSDLPDHRVEWHGALPSERIPGFFQQGGIYVWPGCGEAYGLAYLEAQAAGLPVVAQAIAGVPEVVAQNETGLLTEPGDVAAYANAIRQLLENGAKRRHMSERARQVVFDRHSLAHASTVLSASLAEIGEPRA